MGWSIGFDTTWNRDIGYGVPAYCDHEECNTVIDRGLAHVCGGEPYGGDEGCGLYFCGKHLWFAEDFKHQVCERCRDGLLPFTVKPDCPRWVKWKLTHESWAQWREENPDEVAKLTSEHMGANK